VAVDDDRTDSPLTHGLSSIRDCRRVTEPASLGPHVFAPLLSHLPSLMHVGHDLSHTLRPSSNAYTENYDFLVALVSALEILLASRHLRLSRSGNNMLKDLRAHDRIECRLPRYRSNTSSPTSKPSQRT
jgi:hypothetical protein